MANNTLQSLNVLAVDDDPFMLDLLVSALKNVGIESIVAVTKCVEALEVIDNQTRKIDALLCDLNMPGYHGQDVLSDLNLIDNKIPIIVISGFLDDKISKTLSEYPCVVGIVEKPFDENKLLELIKENI